MDDWEKIKIFADRLLLNVNSLDVIPDETPHKDYFNERIVILQLCQATELLLKAYLIKECGENKIWINRSRRQSIKFKAAVETVSELLQASGKHFDKTKQDVLVDTNKEYRNEIQHLALYVPDGKHKAIRDCYSALKELYDHMFDKELKLSNLDSY